jgi:hypothetical protein
MHAHYRKINDRSQNSSKYHKKDGTAVRAKLKASLLRATRCHNEASAALDFRKFLTPLTTRKPFSWDETPMQRGLGEWQAQMLRQLPVVETSAQPLEDFLPEDHPLECVVRLGERTFYVNTEGSRYARYAFEFNPSILEK